MTTTDYYYNNDWKCVEERDSGESCPRKQYVYGIRGRNDLIERDNYLYNSSSGSPSCSSAGKERHYALADAMGSTTAITNTSGTVAERYSYTAFGQSQVMTASFTNRSLSLYDWQTRFHGEQRDAETGYYNYGYRYYLPELGKWPSRDPIEENGGLNLYGFVRNGSVNRIDVLGFGELWTISGINSTTTKPIGPLEDYVGKFLRNAGMKVDKSGHSSAGTVGATNWNYICPGGKPYVGHPWSKEVLDKEVDEYAEKCCKKREYCGKKICVVMIAPKTATLPPKSSCCNIDISVWWDPYDPVPNQGVRGGAVKESQKHWSKYGTAYPVQSKKFGLLGNHAFQPFMQTNPMYQPDWKPDVMEPAGGRRPLSGKNAPNPMDVIRRYKSSCDITIVCHSQGCNMTMAILNRGCKK
jgi:RHS repeat-associated protein